MLSPRQLSQMPELEMVRHHLEELCKQFKWVLTGRAGFSRRSLPPSTHRDRAIGLAGVIRRYDRPHTLFYCDPPYWQTEGSGVGFGWEQYEAFAELAGTIQGHR